MDTKRVILYGILAFILYSLWINWQQDYPSHRPASASSATAAIATDKNELLPEVDSADNQPVVSESTSAPETHQTSAKNRLISVKTDVLNVNIDLKNGNIVDAKLLNYPVSLASPDQPITILSNEKNSRYVANSGLYQLDGSKPVSEALQLSASQNSYVLNGEEQITVVLKGQSAGGLEVEKRFTFNKGSYLIDVNYAINNSSNNAWRGIMNAQLLREDPKESSAGLFQIGTYVGASYSIPGQSKYKKVPFKDMAKTNLDAKSTGGWIAMQQHYFLSAWVPGKDQQNVFYTRTQNDDYTIGYVSKPFTIAPGSQKLIQSQLYVGPEITSVLNSIAPGLDLTVDYGWLWFLSSLLFSVMKVIYDWVGNWGWTIVIVTLLIKLAFYRLSASSYRSMAGMRKLQPKIQALKERYGDDKAKMSQATMALYRQEKVNPLGGCLPILIQIPVFIALYWVLIESVELRQAPFIFWIKDLAVADPYHILPVIMGATMLIQQRLNPTPPDPMQAKMMMMLPVVFTALFWNFPAGLVLYWIVNNSLSILQQWYITRKYGEVKLATGKVVAKK